MPKGHVYLPIKSQQYKEFRSISRFESGGGGGGGCKCPLNEFLVAHGIFSIHVEKHVISCLPRCSCQALTPLSSPSSSAAQRQMVDHEETLKLNLRQGNRKGQMLSTCQKCKEAMHCSLPASVKNCTVNVVSIPCKNVACSEINHAIF